MFCLQQLHLILTTCAGNWLRTITSDQTVHNNSSLSFWTRRYDITGDKDYWEVINLLLVLPILFYSNILKTEKKILVILGQEIDYRLKIIWNIEIFRNSQPLRKYRNIYKKCCLEDKITKYEEKTADNAAKLLITFVPLAKIILGLCLGKCFKNYHK